MPLAVSIVTDDIERIRATSDKGWVIGRTQTNGAVDRYAIGDRDNLVLNEDGSLVIYIQSKSPGADSNANWLPAPAGKFNLTLRGYWPTTGMINGDWDPPPVVRLP